MSSTLNIDNVFVHYGDFAAVQGVSVTLDAGTIGCLLGPSGCGKTTLLRAIAGFEPVSGGSISLGTRRLSDAGNTVAPERRKIGMVFQDFALFPHLRIEQNVGFGLGDLARKARTQRVTGMLDLVGLADYARAYPHELSGGQQQRIALARALAPSPDLLLLDEPFSSLDAELRQQLATEVRSILADAGITALLVTHDQDEAFAMAAQVTLMKQGRVEQSDTPFNLYHSPASEFVAGFIGRGSLVDLRCDGAGKLAEGLHILGEAPDSWEKPGPCRVLIRPEMVTYAPGSSLELRVKNRTFRGADNFYLLNLPDGQTLGCIAPGDVDLSAGEPMPVNVDLDRAVVLRR